MDYFAHSLSEQPQTTWQTVEEHLLGTAEMARTFAEAFECGEWGYLAGLWHDLGKYSSAFQRYLRDVSASDPLGGGDSQGSRVDHSTAGGQHSVSRSRVLGHLLAYAITGHHSGLLNGRDSGSCLELRLNKAVEPYQHGLTCLADPPFPGLPALLRDALGRRDAFAVSFFTRMLFSCLVDADFLDTEAFFAPSRSDLRPRWPNDVLGRMEGALNVYMRAFGPPKGTVDGQRVAVREACLAAAERPPGLFSLTVPTGGGKTLASLAFALRHAAHHGLERVIYVVPFTSIIEQNAAVFRDVMSAVTQEIGIDVVLEHHSALEPEKETETSRLASENWDAPLIVTTSVQFYESLFGRKTSRCRKLHRLARSVIILDEAQVLPVQYLKPCLRALGELAGSYRSSVVLCTATQPAIHYREDFKIGLRDVFEIAPDPKALYTSLKRVDVSDIGARDDADIAERLLNEAQVLCILNTRGHARALFEALGNTEGHFHLSALMCPAHRQQVLKRIHTRLEAGRICGQAEVPCRVVTTQLIEAGVDIDFPVVYRSLAGLDSIAQAAGRCNRNGRLAELGRTYIFRSEHVRAERFVAETANSATQVLNLHEDPLSLSAIEHYFKLYYWDKTSEQDKKDILGNFHLLARDPKLPFSFSFKKAADDFRLIEQDQEPVIVPWGEKGRKLCEQLRQVPFVDRVLLRKLQRYTVQIRRRVWFDNLNRTIELVHGLYPVLISPELHYSEALGLTLEDNNTSLLEA